MNEKMILNKFKEFTHVAFPMLSIKSAAAYEDALTMVEHLMESVGDNDAPTENLLITLLQQAIQDFEDKNEELIAFENESINMSSDSAVLRVLIDQYRLTLSDLPEIGHKSLVSRILSGERSLTKNHIKKLSQRFKVEPSLFF